MSNTVYDFKVKDISGSEISLNQFQNKVLLFVNVASKCGFTPQYKELEQIYQELKESGLVILGFPCNQFGAQEPGNEEEIKNFCSLNYEISFPMFAKIDVNGDDAHPVYEFLKNSLPGILGTKAVKWNFTKFLVDKNGMPIARFAPNDQPISIKKEILKYL
jgi:glutathione peroxidase